MPNAASLIPAPASRPPLAKAEYQAAAQDGSGFAGLLDIGTETPPAPRETAPSRAEDVRDAKRPEPDQSDRRSETNAADEPRDQPPAGSARPEKQPDTATTAKDGTSAQPNKADDTSAAPGAEPSTTADSETDAEAAVVATSAATTPVVTPVTIALIAEQTAADAAATSETAAIEATSTTTSSTRRCGRRRILVIRRGRKSDPGNAGAADQA